MGVTWSSNLAIHLYRLREFYPYNHSFYRIHIKVPDCFDTLSSAVTMNSTTSHAYTHSSGLLTGPRLMEAMELSAHGICSLIAGCPKWWLVTPISSSGNPDKGGGEKRQEKVEYHCVSEQRKIILPRPVYVVGQREKIQEYQD